VTPHIPGFEADEAGAKQGGSNSLGELISVIIPTFNESERLESVLSPLLGLPEIEIIVVDGASSDGTAEVARRLGVRVLTTRPSRALQMNAGSRGAAGEILLFLHGDTRLPGDFARQVRAICARPGVSAGAFRLAIDGHGWAFRWIETFANLRSRFLQSPYGDQAIFVRSGTFFKLGGFPVMPIMEDFEFVRRARRLGRIAIAPSSAVTSARRWKKLGVLKTTLLNWGIVLAYFAGVPPKRLKGWYRRQPEASNSQLPASRSKLPTANP